MIGPAEMAREVGYADLREMAKRAAGNEPKALGVLRAFYADAAEEAAAALAEGKAPPPRRMDAGGRTEMIEWIADEMGHDLIALEDWSDADLKAAYKP